MMFGKVGGSGGLWLVVAGLAASAMSAGLVVAAGAVDIADQRTRLRLTEEPKKFQQVLDTQKTLSALRTKQNPSATQEVVIRGQIGGMPNVWPEMHPAFPWYEKQASFFLVDSKIAAQFAAHDKHHGGGDKCAFCQSLAERNANAIAVVNLVDERGEIIPVDSRELLGLKERQTVVVRGKARLLGGSMLVIDADKIYTRTK
jgi:hypothetical protein